MKSPDHSPSASGATSAYRLAADTLGSEEIAAAKAVLDSGHLTMGQRVAEFERQFAHWVGLKHAVMVNSGSSANLLTVDSLLRRSQDEPKLQPGDEVIVPGLSWPTTVWPVAQLGLVPVFVDVDATTLAIDLKSAEGIIGPRTRAMFLIHPLGRAADLRLYSEFCRDHDLDLLEDCCESLGAHSSGAHVGTAGSAATFSLYFSHHISTIEGGVVATNDQGLADDLRGLRAHGWVRDRSDRDRWVEANPQFDPRFLFASVGYNVRPTEIQGAIGTIQLQRLDVMLQAREALASTVRGWISNFAPWLELIGGDTVEEAPPRDRRDRIHSWMTLPFRLGSESPVDRDALVRYLEDAGVETRPVIAGNLARHPGAATVPHRAAEMPTSDAILRSTFMIGCHPVASDESLATLERALTGLSRL